MEGQGWLTSGICNMEQLMIGSTAYCMVIKRELFCRVCGIAVSARLT